MKSGSVYLPEMVGTSGAIVSFSADLHLNGERRIASLPIMDPEFEWDGSAKIQGSGSCTVVWSSDFAESLSPTGIGDDLAPFGAELFVSCTISVGPFSETIPVGWFPIADVPSARDEFGVFRGRSIVTGSLVELELQDRFMLLDVDPFDVPTSPVSLSSVWDEAARITEFQVTRSVPDALIPRLVVHPENRLDALYELFNVIDAVPFMTPDGTLSARPNTWAAASGTLRLGAGGSLLEADRGLSPEGVFNRVVVRGEGDDNAAILASAEVREGPLRVRNPDGSPSPFRRRTKSITSQYVTSNADALVLARQELAKSAQVGVRSVPVVELFNPLREVGDVYWLETPGRRELARVTKVGLSEAGQTPMTLEVRDG